MDVDPLQDTVPPRHQIESDESEDEDAYPVGAAPKRAVKLEPIVEFDWSGQQERNSALIVALDEAGRQWIRGVQLGESRGELSVNGVQVASIYTPTFADTFVVQMEMRLPLYIIHAVTTAILSNLSTNDVVIIDSYPLPSYISSSSTSLNPPIRFLCTSKASKNSLPGIEPLSPPNIIQSPAASFLSILEFPSHATSATLLLLPSAYISPPAPHELQVHYGPDLREEWDTATLVRLHKAVCALLGTDSTWKETSPSTGSSKVKRSRRGDIGDGGIYM